jgi:hypothetical protein
VKKIPHTSPLIIIIVIIYTNTQVVGISVGAFAADACVKEYHKQLALDSGGTTTSRLTLLCAFQSRGAFEPGYGVKNFGEGATFCEQFITKDGKSVRSDSAVNLQ